ncbi:hypothetical protein GCM10028772_04380 [Nocardioides ultimimeridianus]
MRGVATIDRQPGGHQIAVWVTSSLAQPSASHVNAVVMEAEAADTHEKVRSLTRSCVVLATDGSTLDGLPVEGAVLHTSDLDHLLDETAVQQNRIVDAIRSYRGSLVVPTFPDRPEPRDFQPTEDTASARAFAAASYLRAAWHAWLKTEDERVRRTIQPRTGKTPWIMPEDMNSPVVATFPEAFAARLTEQALV